MATNKDRQKAALNIVIKKSKQGSLHSALGVAQDQKIPVSKMQKAANSDSPALRKKAQFAINARKWNN